MQTTRLFDLNIEKILEAWDAAHAVRELIANALDEQTISGTAEIEIKKAAGVWTIRDYGRGLRYEHFTQNENPEKVAAVGRVIGKFGVGLKDALATLHRAGVGVELESRYAVITLRERAKHGFDDVITLHAEIAAPRDKSFIGTAVCLKGLPDDEMSRAKAFFLKFSGEKVLEDTQVGSILAKKGRASRIYVAGLLIAEEENFAFSYNITSLTKAMKKALNRERTNVGRTAYGERVRAMLLQAKSDEVARTLAEQMRNLDAGLASDELKSWKEVAIHACKILNGSGKNLFVSSLQLTLNASAVDRARSDGLNVIVVPQRIYLELADARDLAGEPVRNLEVYQKQWNDSFKFKWVPIDKLTAKERRVLAHQDRILNLVGGRPRGVKVIRISETMRMDAGTGQDAVGLWDEETSAIIIRRDQLKSLSTFAGTLLHEVAHARSECVDLTIGFEEELTDLLGEVAAAAMG